ncbi:MAG: fumarate hydratase [Treponema sp.]|jgi:fumarate hydratase class I|nr:fumarate hydratase [Treponema sp.]
MLPFAALSRAFSRAPFVKVTIDEAIAPRLTSDGRLYVPPHLLRAAAERAFHDLAFYFRESYLRLLHGALADPAASANDRFVIGSLLRNAEAAAEGVLASCQDTGTAGVLVWKDEAVFCGADERVELEHGIAAAYRANCLRASQTIPVTFFDEKPDSANLPAQVRVEAVPDSAFTDDRAGSPAYRFLFSARGGGSANKTVFFPLTPALLEPAAFDAFLREKITAIGTAACPPCQLAVVVGGQSPETNLDTLKLALAGALDFLPFFDQDNDERGAEGAAPARRDRRWEERALQIGRDSGWGAQFGGAAFLLSARVIRLPRHAASCPVSLGVSCAAHRYLLARITAGGLFVERLCREPRALFPSPPPAGEGHPVNLDLPQEALLRELAGLAAGTLLRLSGRLVLARDQAHLRWHGLIEAGKALPAYLYRHPVFYAGPAETPPGLPSGSLGPTTASRMDPYAEELLSRGASMVTLGKGNRGPAWDAARARYGACYLAAPGGIAALIAKEHISASEVLDYPELGMEAVRLVTVKDLPAFVG